MKTLLALLVLGVSAPIAVADGSAQVLTWQGGFALDAPPPGATKLFLRFDNIHAVAQYGVERTATPQTTKFSPIYTTVTSQCGVALFAGTDPNPICGERFNFGTNGRWLEFFDNSLDYFGPSGMFFVNEIDRGASPWYVYDGLPSRIHVRRRQVMSVTGCDDFASTNYTGTQLTVSWYWQ